MTTNRFDVCVDWAGKTLRVGTLYASDRSAAVGFEYSSTWPTIGSSWWAVARADRFGLRLAAARTIVAEVQAAIGRWRWINARAGIAEKVLAVHADALSSP
jgi:hypothetical protein